MLETMTCHCVSVKAICHKDSDFSVAIIDDLDTVRRP